MMNASIIEPGSQAKAGFNHLPFADGQPRRPSLAEKAIGTFRRLDLFPGRRCPHRHIPGDDIILKNRGGIGQYPVMVPVLAAVLNQPGPRPLLLDRCPKIGKRLRRHVRVANNIVGLADQLGFAEAANLKKSLVNVGDLPLEISLRDDVLSRQEHDLMLRYRQIDFHGFTFINEF
jgi:hypothetical protein